jgi:hypothetical protein
MKTEVWFLELVRTPGNSRVEFGYRDRWSGRRVWSTVPWMAPCDPVTEIETLQELYGALMDVMEARQTLG